MKHKVYYGEYTLQHWIDLMLSEDIIMPPYQRSFVWNEEMVQRMVKNLGHRYFVPPIIIGQYNDGGQIKNLILDGQQRLTSLLLAKLDIFPDKTKFASTLKVMMDENDDPTDNDDSYKSICDWTYRKITEGNRSIEQVKSSLSDKKDYYKHIDYHANDQFFENNYLGFCYLIPKATENSQQQRYYSSLFRSINAQGVALLAQESRESLYFLDASKANFFKPDFIESINIKTNRGITHIDFARFLALLSNYKAQGNYNKIAAGIKKDFESYYEDFIQAKVNDEDSEKFGKFSQMFPSDELPVRSEKLKERIHDLKLQEKTYNSIINLDIDFLGLVYYVLFEGKDIDLSRKVSLKDNLQQKIKLMKKDSNHTKNPSGLTNVRERIKASLNIYKRYSV